MWSKIKTFLKWNYLDKIITISTFILTIIIAYIAISNYFSEPVPKLYIGSTYTLGKPKVKKTKNTSYVVLPVEIGLHNVGKAEIKTAQIKIIFSRFVKNMNFSGKNWKKEPHYTDKFDYYSYTNDLLRIHHRVNRTIANAELLITEELREKPLAMFFLEGNFKLRSGFIYYDLKNNKFKINHFEKKEEKQMIKTWNSIYN